MKFFKRYLLRVLVAFDQLSNAAFGGLTDETISARAGRANLRGRLWGRVLCGFLDWLSPGHCWRAMADVIARAQRAERAERAGGRR